MKYLGILRTSLSDEILKRLRVCILGFFSIPTLFFHIINKVYNEKTSKFLEQIFVAAEGYGNFFG